MLRCNIRATKRGKKRMKRNKVLRGGPEPLIFFSLMHRAPCHAASPFSRAYLPRLFNSSNFSFIRAISLVRFQPSRTFLLYVVNVPSILSFDLTHSLADRLSLSLPPPLGYSHSSFFFLSFFLSCDFEAGRRF